MTKQQELIAPPPELIVSLGEAYRDYLIETRELITLAYAAGYEAARAANAATRSGKDLDP